MHVASSPGPLDEANVHVHVRARMYQQYYITLRRFSSVKVVKHVGFGVKVEFGGHQLE